MGNVLVILSFQGFLFAHWAISWAFYTMNYWETAWEWWQPLGVSEIDCLRFCRRTAIITCSCPGHLKGLLGYGCILAIASGDGMKKRKGNADL